MAGRKPKPTAVKKLEGNPGKRKLNKKEACYPMLKNAYFRAGLVWAAGLMLIVGLVAVLVTGKDDM